MENGLYQRASVSTSPPQHPSPCPPGFGDEWSPSTSPRLPPRTRVRVMLCSGVMSGEGAGAPDLDPSCYLFLPCSHGPEGCHVHLLGNLSPFTLDPRKQRDRFGLLSQTSGFPAGISQGPVQALVPTPRGPAVQSGQGLSGFGKLQPDKGGKTAETGASSRAGRATLRRAAAERGRRGGGGGEYCLYRAGDCHGL